MVTFDLANLVPPLVSAPIAAAPIAAAAFALMKNDVTLMKNDVMQITTTRPDADANITIEIPNTTLTNCPNCGAPLRGKKKRCEYCATEF